MNHPAAILLCLPRFAGNLRPATCGRRYPGRHLPASVGGTRAATVKEDDSNNYLGSLPVSPAASGVGGGRMLDAGFTGAALMVNSTYQDDVTFH
jgi:hypothetical protein